MNTQNFLSVLDNDHLARVGELWIIKILVDNISQLHVYKKEVTLLFRTRVAKDPLPQKPTKVRPLASSSKNEPVLTELKDALLDIFEQIGQTKDTFKHHKLAVDIGT